MLIDEKLEKEQLEMLTEKIDNNLPRNGVRVSFWVTTNKRLVNNPLVPMNLGDLDVLIRMDWLGRHEAKIIRNKQLLKVKTIHREVITINEEQLLVILIF